MTAAAPLFPDPMLPETFPVARVQRVTDDVTDIVLDASVRGGLRFLPGQFNMLWVFGVGEVPISISSDPSHADESCTRCARWAALRARCAA